MAVGCYNTGRNWVICAENRVQLRKNTRITSCVGEETDTLKRDYDVNTRIIRKEFPMGTHLFMRKEHWNEKKESEPKRLKMATIADGPFEVQVSDADTVVISYRDGTVERISKDRVVRAPVSAEDIVTPGHDESGGPPPEETDIHKGEEQHQPLGVDDEDYLPPSQVTEHPIGDVAQAKPASVRADGHSSYKMLLRLHLSQVTLTPESEMVMRNRARLRRVPMIHTPIRRCLSHFDLGPRLTRGQAKVVQHPTMVLTLTRGSEWMIAFQVRVLHRVTTKSVTPDEGEAQG